ncbi:MAG: imidazole glycerol phosphate synthase subunit HisH [Burkholderiaceae bacterium]|nr:imidazole glycerol phosphate synthase subunit HisH [Burkholderiaceae bacterium]
MKIAIIDYGSGNLRSVSKAVEKVAEGTAQVIVTSDPEVVYSADRVVFPGQGAMPDCMAHLRMHGLEEAVRDSIANKPFFAVCIGEQMLFEHSEEGNVEGLGIFPGSVVRFPNDMHDSLGERLKVPQMGWNRVKQTMNHPIWAGVPNNSWYYFVHSYYAKPENESIVAGVTEYGIPVTVAVAKDNVFAAQFHPEKSAAMGLQLYKNFLTWRP